MLEVFVKRDHEDVNQAVMQFVARRSYTLTKPWYLEGIRIETPLPKTEAPRGFWASAFSESPANPRIDIELKRKRHGTRIKMSLGAHTDSIKLAYELQTWLQDDAAYNPQCPAVCFKCGSPVRNAIARYCGRCGQRFAAASVDEDRAHPQPAADLRQEKRPAAQAMTPPPIPVTIERDDAAEIEIDEEFVPDEPPVDEQKISATRPDDRTPAAVQAEQESKRESRTEPVADAPDIERPAPAIPAPAEPASESMPADVDSNGRASDSDSPGRQPSESIAAEPQGEDEPDREERQQPPERRRRALAEE